ncbi:hypothetical protein WMO25_02255 [Coprococcus sp. CLA-AA-H190]|uniref:Uncharacterized protein n=1 Tax=Coprococcus intestinihominis TaxID=3133154 RepID=A0ABV1B1T6_9FIRM
MQDYLFSATLKAIDFYEETLIKTPDYNAHLYKLLAQYPEISKFTSYCSPTLSYGSSDLDTYNASADIYNELLMRRNFLTRDFKASFNPFNALKSLLSLPSAIFSAIGFNLGNISSKIVNIFGWIITYFLGMYANEIKAFISSLFK